MVNSGDFVEGGPFSERSDPHRDRACVGTIPARTQNSS